MPSTRPLFFSAAYAAFASMAIFLFAPVAYACGKDQQQVFTCKTKNNKVVEVCNAGKDVTYSFGRAGAKPELFLRKPKTSLSFTHDSLAFSLTFPNGATTYTIAYAGRTVPVAASVEVSANQGHLASVACEAGGVTANFAALGLDVSAGKSAASAPGAAEKRVPNSSPQTDPGEARWIIPASGKTFKTSIGKFSIKSSDYSEELLFNGSSLLGNTDFFDEKLEVKGVLDYGNKVALLIFTDNRGSGRYYRAVALMLDSTGRITSFADLADTDPASYKLSDGNWISKAEPIAGNPRRVTINQHGIRVDILPRAHAKGTAPVTGDCTGLYETFADTCPNLRPQDCKLLATRQDGDVFGKTEARGELRHFTTGDDRMIGRAYDDPGTDYVALVRTCAAACSATKMPFTLKEFEQKVCRGR